MGLASLSWSSTPTAIRAAGIAALLGFVVRCSSTTSTRSNGRLVECSYTDAGALLAGVVAVVGGLVGIALSVRRTEDRAVLLAVSAVSVALGVVHLLRGVGTIGGPCN